MKNFTKTFQQISSKTYFSAIIIFVAFFSASLLSFPGSTYALEDTQQSMRRDSTEREILMAKATYKVTVVARNKNGGNTRTTEIVDANNESDAADKAVERVKRRYPDNTVRAEKVELK
jgi:hypothetical protein